MFESVHLIFQFPDQTSVWILVDHSVTLDLLGPVSIPAEERTGCQDETLYTAERGFNVLLLETGFT